MAFFFIWRSWARDPEPSGLKMYAFLHGTLSLRGSGYMHFYTGP